MCEKEPLYGWMKDGAPRPLPWRRATPPLDGLVRSRGRGVEVVSLRRERRRRGVAVALRVGSAAANALLVGGAVAALWPSG